MTKYIRTYPIAYILTLAVLWGCVVLPWSVHSAEASVKDDIPPGVIMGRPEAIKPVLAGIQVSQIGGTMLRLRLRGFDLPYPDTVSSPGDARLVLQWIGVRFPQTTDKRDWWDNYDWDILYIEETPANSWWKQYDIPLLNRINAEMTDEGNLSLSFVTSKPMVIDGIQGVAGADELLILLKVDEPVATPAPLEVQKVYGPGDPLGMKAPVTLQLRDAELKSVFRMLADMQKLNLFIDPSVPDMTITFSFNGVPYSEAFRYLLRAAELDYKVENSMLIVAKPESLIRVLGNEITRSYKLSYAINADGQVRSDLTAALTGLISLPQPPVLDAPNRELYITTSPEQHREVEALLEKLDKPGRQVMLEARIFEVSDNGRQDLETVVTGIYNNWLATFTASGVNVGYNYANSPWDNSNGDWSLPIGGALGGSPVIERFPMEGAKLLSTGLRALETKGKGKNIANPSVITLDGHQADIDLSRTVTYVSGVDSNGNPNISSVSYGPHMNFLPVIGRDGVVTIRIMIQAGDLIQFRSGGMGAQVPETSNRRVETTVRVRNGEPFVVGGLFQDIKTQSRNRIPVLGYIPLLGDLFTFRSDTHNKSEVAIIVIPYILDVPDSGMETFDLLRTSGY